MRIQEMRFGIARMRKKADVPGDVLSEIRSMIETDQVQMPEQVFPHDPQSELEETRWAILSFDRIEATGLTYPQAAHWINELELQGKTGLCLVTDEAAARQRP